MAGKWAQTPSAVWNPSRRCLQMKASQVLISTPKEAPADAEVLSHQLMTRAGMIKKLGAGIYTYMPMGLRVIRKVEAIVREEMNRAGAIEVTMPVVQPAELWQETGRLEKMGPELLRTQDVSLAEEIRNDDDAVDELHVSVFEKVLGESWKVLTQIGHEASIVFVVVAAIVIGALYIRHKKRKNAQESVDAE